MLSSSKSGLRIRGFRGSALNPYFREKTLKVSRMEESLGPWDINRDKTKMHETSWSLNHDHFCINNEAERFLLESMPVNEFFMIEEHQVPAFSLSGGLSKIQSVV